MGVEALSHLKMAMAKSGSVLQRNGDLMSGRARAWFSHVKAMRSDVR